ncbi:MAG: class I SAM-dependent methyltransferase [Ruminococcus flavefaciens]|nr:class I SAM-dependent methyltransferase [Ruminococcus flavefaciens]MCM1230918.1 class I SAM-dependent methyltransferase [Ruminococcus flavefaciens]
MNKKNWDKFAPIYNIFMKKNKKAYAQMYQKIRTVVKGKKVLELATGTGLIAENISDFAKSVEATDYSEKMIAQARKNVYANNIHFAVANACNLPYHSESFDVVIISNALHIMPEPEKALAEIRRVLKKDGIMIAPTFVHAQMPLPKRMLSKAMGIVGFRAEHKWTEETYLHFLRKNGWKIRRKSLLNASFPLVYAECVYL